MMKHALRDFVTVPAWTLALAAALALPPALAQTAASGAFRNLSAIESTLQRGVTTKANVRTQLGIPNGSGGALLPTVPIHDLLLYESDTMDGATMHMKMLIVFVTRSTGLYEGYLWFNSGLLLSPAK